MTIGVRLERIRGLIDRIRRYNHLIAEDSLQPTTVDDMKGKAKDLCDEIRAEADLIKNDIDQWS